MYIVKNKVYADAGYVLIHNNTVSFSFENVDQKDIIETKIDLEDMRKIGKFIVYGKLKDYISCIEYKDWKKKWINKQFTNDDQIAIILNKEDSEEDLFLFNKMQEWREWSGVIAKKITAMISNE